MALFGKFWQLLKFCNLTAACHPAPPRAAAPHSAASTSPAESRAIQRIQGIRSPNRRELMIMATDSLGVKGNHIAQSANQRLHRAPLWRNTTSDCHCRGTNPPSRHPQLGHSEGEEATKKLFSIGSVKKKFLKEKSACERAGTARARTASSQARCYRATLTRSTGVDLRTNDLTVGWVCAARAASAFATPSCWHSVPPSRCSAALVPPPRAPPTSYSSTHTHYTQVLNSSTNCANDYSPLCLRSPRRERFSQRSYCRYAAALAHS